MDLAKILQESSAANAVAVQDIINDLEAALVRLKVAQVAFAAAKSWDEFDGAYIECAGAVRGLPSVETMLWNVVKDPL